MSWGVATMVLIVFIIVCIATLIVAVLLAEQEDEPLSRNHPSNIRWDDEREYRPPHHWKGDDE